MSDLSCSRSRSDCNGGSNGVNAPGNPLSWKIRVHAQLLETDH